MTYETTTSMPASEVLAHAKRFFQERIPAFAAFPEKEGPAYLTLRGQGGEEIAISVSVSPGGTKVRAGTLLFDQAVGRFFSTLPEAAA